ncbi:MAG: acylphosphatase [Atopobiaceae bacterium]|jgi:acylphosphatase|nr:acylphosphatase [Atopobiaceae bacterium]MCI1539555.1 acylphosphatase [Atopobiaceae bacterium]
MAEEGRKALRRCAVHFVGQVQGVGFRWTSRRIALELGLTGWVRNEWDGSVRMELQGTPDAISSFFGKLQNVYRDFPIDYRIDDIVDIAPVEDEGPFTVKLR